MSTKPIHRITLFKISKSSDQESVIASYTELSKTAVKDGKPYILSLSVGRCLPDPLSRSKGFTVAAKTVFKSKEDMDYYDNECQAHKKFKTVTGPVREDVCMVYFEDASEEGKL